MIFQSINNLAYIFSFVNRFALYLFSSFIVDIFLTIFFVQLHLFSDFLIVDFDSKFLLHTTIKKMDLFSTYHLAEKIHSFMHNYEQYQASCQNTAPSHPPIGTVSLHEPDCVPDTLF